MTSVSSTYSKHISIFSQFTLQSNPYKLQELTELETLHRFSFLRSLPLQTHLIPPPVPMISS